MDTLARRNAFGRQVHSFEDDLTFPDVEGGPVRAVFIRAPWIEEHGPGVEVLAEVDGHPVAARQGELHVLAFHPELSGDAAAARGVRRGASRPRRRCGATAPGGRPPRRRPGDARRAGVASAATPSRRAP